MIPQFTSKADCGSGPERGKEMEVFVYLFLLYLVFCHITGLTFSVMHFMAFLGLLFISLCLFRNYTIQPEENDPDE
jgi:hypothetical protein